MIFLGKKIGGFWLASLFCVTSLFFGCSDDDGASVDKYVAEGEYDKGRDDLKNYECDSGREGVIVYLSEEDERMVCYNGSWIDYSEWKDMSSSSSKKKSSSSVASDSDDEITSSSSGKKLSSSSTKRSSSSSKTAADVRKDSTVCEDYSKCLGSFHGYSDLPGCDKDQLGSVAYVESQERYFECRDSIWVEKYNYIYGTTECTPDLQGMALYDSDERDTLVCIDGEWYPMWNFYVGNRQDFDVWSEGALDHEISHYIKDLRDSLLPACTKAEEGKIIYDKRLPGYSSNGYFRCNEKHWYVLPDSVADTVGLASAPEGSFIRARFSMDTTYERRRLPAACLIHGEDDNPVYYVYDDGAWRRASNFEICGLNACLKSMEGDEYLLFGFLFRCENNKWVQDTIPDLLKKEFFNPDVSYGTLKDSRDGRTYKTVKISGRTWMAENLNYSDASVNMKGKTYCYMNDSAMCETYGRYYEWTAAMNIDPKYDSTVAPKFKSDEDRRGVCPQGWHIPDSLEWKELMKNGPQTAFMSKKGWAFDYNYKFENIHKSFNETGFSAVPAGYRRDGYYSSIGRAAYFCTSDQQDSVVAAEVGFTYTSDFIGRTYKTDTRMVRCIQNLGEE